MRKYFRKVFVLFSIVSLLGSQFGIVVLSKSSESQAIEEKILAMTVGKEFDMTRVLVKYKDVNYEGASVANIDGKVVAQAMVVGDNKGLDIKDYATASASDIKNVQDLLKTLLADPNVEYAEPNYVGHTAAWTDAGLTSTSGDYDVDNHWYYTLGNVPEMWDDQSCATGGANCGGDSTVVVAVIDSGLAYEKYNDTGSTGFEITDKNFTVVGDDYDPGVGFNIYTNSGEVPGDGKDNDCNGVIDDYNGFDSWAWWMFTGDSSDDFYYPGADTQQYCSGATPYDFSGYKFAHKMGHPVDTYGHGSYVTGLVGGMADGYHLDPGDRGSDGYMLAGQAVEVVSNQPIYTTQKATVNGSLNEFPGISASSLDTVFYYPAYANNGSSVKGDIKVANPSDASSTANVTIKMNGATVGTYALAPGERISHNSMLAGQAVEVVSDQPIYTTQKATVNGSLNEFAGISASSLDTTYYYPAYAHNGAAVTGYIKVANPSDAVSTANVTIKMNGATVGTYALAPGDRISHSSMLAGQAVEVVSDQPIYTTQKATVSGSLNEFAGVSASSLDTTFYYPAYANNSTTIKGDIKVANPSDAVSTANVTIKMNGVTVGTYALAAGDRISHNSMLAGQAVEVISDQPIYTTQKATVSGSLNEFAGISSSNLDTVFYYPAYANNGTSIKADIKVGNPSSASSTANVILKMNGEIQNSVGPAHNVSIMPIAANIPFVNGFYASEVIGGIYYATEHGADVINMSLGGFSYSATMQTAINYANTNGVVVVAASGNENASSVSYPAAFTNVIAVGSVNSNGGRSSYSNYGAALDFVAYVGDGSNGQTAWQETLTCFPCNSSSSFNATSTQYGVGTSYASPQVAAAVAILIGNNPGITPAEVYTALENTSSEGGVWNMYTGYGSIDFEAVNLYSTP